MLDVHVFLFDRSQV